MGRDREGEQDTRVLTLATGRGASGVGAWGQFLAASHWPELALSGPLARGSFGAQLLPL